MPTKHEWRRSHWARPTRTDRFRQRLLRSWLADQIAGLEDGDALPFNVTDLRTILDQTAPGEPEPGATIKDKERGVTYRVTLDPTPGSVGIRTVEVEVKPGSTDPGVFRVPIAELIRETAAMVKMPGIVIGQLSGTPSASTLAALVRAGVSRADIAKRYGRSVGRVDQWLRDARTDHPKLDWTRPSKPKTTGGDRQPGN